MSLKILHTADVHLGVKLNFLREKADQQRAAIKNAFTSSVSAAIDRKADIFLVAGDLFDSPYPAESSVDFVVEQLQRLSAARIYVAVIAGNHDYLAKGSVFISSKLTRLQSEYIKIFGPDYEVWDIPSLGAVVHGKSTKDKNSQTSPLKDVKQVPAKVNIGLFHGSLDNVPGQVNHPISSADLNKINFNYVALGDWHSTKSISSNVWYSGAPELVNLSQQGSGNCLLVELDNTIRVDQLKVGKRKVLPLTIELAMIADYSDLKKRILAASDKDAIAQIILKGNKRMDIDFASLYSDLAENFFSIILKDDSRIAITTDILKELPKNSLMAKFVQNLQKQKTNDAKHNQLIDQAIQLGLSMTSAANVD